VAVAGDAEDGGLDLNTIDSEASAAAEMKPAAAAIAPPAGSSFRQSKKKDFMKFKFK
jgi:hypothetical protein